MEVCIPIDSVHQHHNNMVKSNEMKESTQNFPQVIKSPNIQQPFQKIRESGRQNELMANKFKVFHEKQSK